jgi:hypothetical protein
MEFLQFCWKICPSGLEASSYLVPVSESDRMIPPAVEHMFTKQMNATTISLPTSHASFESHPQEIAQLVLNATGKWSDNIAVR